MTRVSMTRCWMTRQLAYLLKSGDFSRTKVDSRENEAREHVNVRKQTGRFIIENIKKILNKAIKPKKEEGAEEGWTTRERCVAKGDVGAY